jgi:hypothetical protein
VRVEGVGMSDGLVDPVHGLLSVVGDEASLDTADHAGAR